MYFFNNFFANTKKRNKLVLYSQVIKQGFGINYSKEVLTLDANENNIYAYQRILDHVIRNVAVANILGDHHFVLTYFNGDITPFFEDAPGTPEEIASMKNALNNAIKRWRDSNADNLPIFNILIKMELLRY